ncbi:hypothetical protein [Bosea sp. (in: a-proteobacteria)]|uniref:hypothetical protein n=1 Tax=Bosea sp. (in: a-proteobacteria) TaxID=1871050 RepID=UPI0011FEA83F|nr:hypothetical protein [Bosea sp. (in: a-proteobacteria)]TAJ33322.1 MAG: hypothetical protein EPO59_05995 [Bosea sp. (in: a-proteobacteria)]
MGFDRPSWEYHGTAPSDATCRRASQWRSLIFIGSSSYQARRTRFKFGIRKADCEHSCGGVPRRMSKRIGIDIAAGDPAGAIPVLERAS